MSEIATYTESSDIINYENQIRKLIEELIELEHTKPRNFVDQRVLKNIKLNGLLSKCKWVYRE